MRDSGNRSLDHLMFTTRDLPRCQTAFERLGFQLTPKGSHAELGTANHTAMFEDGTYLELLSVVTPSPVNAAYRAAIAAQGDGIGGIALKTANAETFYNKAREANLPVELPIYFERWVDEVREFARFTIVKLAPGTAPPLSLFVCQHHTPQFVWLPDRLHHPNGVIGIKTVVLTDPEKAIGKILGALFGEHGDFSFKHPPPGITKNAAVGSVCFTVRNLELTAAWLGEHDVPFVRSQSALRLTAAESALEFVFHDISGSDNEDD